MKKMSVLMPLGLAAILLVAAGCNPVSKYNDLISAYQGAQEAAANGQSCFALTGNQISLQISLYNSYLSTDVEKTKVYRDALKSASDQLSAAQKAYTDSNGVAIPSNKLDLSQLAAQNATPAGLAGGLTLMVQAFTEAPLAAVDPSALINTQRIITEQYNQAMSCVTDWNNAVRVYNTVRNQASGDIVGQVAQKLGVKDLPESLPYFTPPANSSNPFNVTAATPVLP